MTADGLDISVTREIDMPQLTPIQQRFILHWGEMGSRWGINRTIAQVHALLYISAKPIHAEDIAETLQVARSNVSNSVKELQGWGIVRMVHVMGDKRDHFESLHDVWELFRIVLDERKKREVDPTLMFLNDCLIEAGKAPDESAVTIQRLEALRDFFRTTNSWYDIVRRLPTQALGKLLRGTDKMFGR